MGKVRGMYYELSIGGKILDGDTLALIDSITYNDESSGSDILTISMTDPDFVILGDNDIYIEEQTVTFKGGWEDDVSVNFSGYISVIDIDFPPDGSPKIVLHCMDNSHLMNRKKKKRTWENKKESDVVSAIFKEYGLTANVDSTDKVVETISQSNVTDIEFLISLANNQDDVFLVYIEGNKGYFKKKKTASSPQATLVYRDKPYDIVSFSPRINKQMTKEEVEVSDIDSTNKKVNKSVANTTNTPRVTQGTPVKTTSKKTAPKTQPKPSPSSRRYIGDGQWVEIK